MPLYHMKLSKGREAEVTIEADNAQEALNAGYNALALFVCRNFPPPDCISIQVVDADRSPVGHLKMTFEIETVVGT